MTKKEILLIGCGYWGKNWYATIKNSKYNLAGVVDPDPAINVDCKLFNNIADVDVAYTHVIVVVPPVWVNDIVIQIKLPHTNILVEKPCGTNLFDIQRIENVYPGFIFLHASQYKYIKKHLNLIGKPLLYKSTRASMGPKVRTDVSILEDYLIHDLYIFMDLFGKNIDIKSVVFCNSLNSPVKADTISLILNSNDIQCNMFSSWRFPVKIREVTIVGTEGSFIWKDTRLEFCTSKYSDIEGFDEFVNINNRLYIGETNNIVFDTKSNLELELDDFINKKLTSINLIDVWKLIDEINKWEK